MGGAFQLFTFNLKLSRMSSLHFSRIPGLNNLFLDFVYSFEKVADLYPSADKVPDYEIPHRTDLSDILQRQNESFENPSTGALTKKLRGDGVRCLITGQQVGLLCSPLYTLYKALTAIYLSRKFEAQGTPCVPVFWMATEDHNLNEITSFALLKPNNDLLQFSLKDHLFLKRQPAGTVKTENEEIRKILIRAFSELKIPEVRSFYSGSTLAVAFARTLLWILKDFPILIVDPSDPALKKLASPFFGKVVDKINDLLDLLNQQNGKLKERNYPTQVQMEEDRLPLFKINKNERVPVRRGETNHLSGEIMSPSALLRPLFQDYLFPTLGYTAGPAEVAYFAQLHPWYEAMEMQQPRLFPRASVTLIPASIRSFLTTHHLNPEEIYLHEDTLVDALLDHEGMKQTRKDLKDLQNVLNASLPKIQKNTISIDPTLEKGLNTAFRKMEYQLKKMERKAFLAAKRKNLLLAEQIRKAKNVIYPDEKLQERYVSVFSFAPKLPELIRQVYDQIQWDSNAHQFIDV
jgi:bacillithiol synthase